MATLRPLLRRRQKNSWAIGKRLAKILRDGLWRASGAHQLREWFRSELPGISVPTAYRYASVSKNFTARDVARWGVSRLAWLVLYEQGRLGALRIGDPGARDVQVPQPDGAMASKQFFICTLREMRDACRGRTAGRVPPATV